MLIQAYRYLPNLYEKAEEDPKFNSFGILSVIGLECVKDSTARSKLLNALYKYSTETVGNYTISYNETEPYYTISVTCENAKFIEIGWDDNAATRRGKQPSLRKECLFFIRLRIYFFRGEGRSTG